MRFILDTLKAISVYIVILAIPILLGWWIIKLFWLLSWYGFDILFMVIPVLLLLVGVWLELGRVSRKPRYAALESFREVMDQRGYFV